MKPSDKKTSAFIVINEVTLDLLRFPDGTVAIFENAAWANAEASRQMLELWSVHHLSFFHPFVQHTPNFKSQEHPLPCEGEFSAPLMEFFEEAELMFEDFPGGRRFVVQTLREDRSVSKRLREIGVPTEHIFEILDWSERGAIDIKMTEGFIHLTVNKDSLTFDREPDKQMFKVL